MKCLVDADILCYEVAAAAESSWKHEHPHADPLWLFENPPPFDWVETKLKNVMAIIEGECESTEPSIMFFTGKTNFRNDIAKTVPYKPRLDNKPYHYHNVKAYLKGAYVFQQMEGLEADDLMSIYQLATADETVICSRDKDLRAVSGLVYSWECNGQARFGPYCVGGYGKLSLSNNRQKLDGFGLKFFLGQCLTGDRIDGIPGLAGMGAVGAYKILGDTQTYTEGLEAVREAYSKSGGDAYLLEQGRLLWMTRELHEDGSPVLWNLEENYEE